LKNLDKKNEILFYDVSSNITLNIKYGANIRINNDCNISKSNYSYLGRSNSYETP
jgi:hypothetical protein